MSILEKSPQDLTDRQKYGLVVAVFQSYLMITTGCTQRDASMKIAELCTLAQLGESHGR